MAFAATGTPPEVLRNHRWRDALTATIQHAKALEYKGPEYNSMREETLDRVVDDLQKKLDDMEKKVKEFGSTLVSDGRKDVAGRPPIDFVSNTPLGPIFNGADDMSGM